MPKPKESEKAPDFELPSSDGKIISLKDLRGKNVVIYFYPKDDTPGCTVEACGFRDKFKELKQLNTVVLGVSPDNENSHQKFIKKFNLPFLLLSDTQKTMCQDYGVWVKKSMYGRSYMGVERTTFVINSEGKITKVFEKVKPQGHEDEVIEMLKSV